VLYININSVRVTYSSVETESLVFRIHVAKQIVFKIIITILSGSNP